MKSPSERKPAKIEWEGDSKEVLSNFPHERAKDRRWDSHCGSFRAGIALGVLIGR